MLPESQPSGKNYPAPHATDESSEKRDAAEAELQFSPTPIKTNGDNSPYHCEITHKTEKSRWDHVKPFVEAAGLILLAVYTGYTVKMYNVTRKALIATNAAVFDCSSDFQAGAARFVVECRNRGNAPARDIDADLTFTQTESGNTIQSIRRNLQRTAIVRENEFAFIIPIKVRQVNWDWISKEAMEARLSFSYNDGVDVVKEQDCWALVLEPKNRGWAVTDCQNAAAINTSSQNK